MRNQDFVKELGYLGFTTRLKRISDMLMHEGRRLYSELDIDIEPNWFVIFKLLQTRGPMSVTEIADSILMSHPSIIAITNKMLASGYLLSEKDKTDSRKRVLELSDRAVRKLPSYTKIWKAGEEGVESALKGYDALEFLTRVEDVFSEKGFKERTLSQLKKTDE